MDKKFEKQDGRISNIQAKQSGLSAVVSMITAGITVFISNLFHRG